ncbi:acyltransferase family protein [Sinobacterium caligoides]|uniref:acyltransferase family protein n=1 Tax=Sinobacterium caligoides TaxID=933926 RepID=UPI0013C2FD7F|nr:acyltransferase [Sinobacterium caligoides]
MKYTSLESLRGIAALLVALFHSVFVSGSQYPVIAQGIMFVDFFFILSGFVMACAYLEKIQAGLPFRQFFLLRFGRLYPLHLFMLLLWLGYAVLKELLHHQLGMGPGGFFAGDFATFVSNLLLINSLGVDDDLSWNYPAWSISVEFYTYLIFFAVVGLLARRIKHYYFLLLSVLSYAWLYWLTEQSLLSTYQYGILRCTGGFFLGVFIFIKIERKTLAPSRLLASVIELSSILLALWLVTLSTENKLMQLCVLASFGLVISVFAVQDRGLVSTLLNRKSLLLLGTLSYSIYMIHALFFALLRNIGQYVFQWPLVVVERAHQGPIQYFDTAYADLINLACVLAIVLLSALSYRYIERPWRAKFRLLAQRKKHKQQLRDC